MIVEFDDFGSSHIISDQCRSHDCRDQLDKLHILNPAFKCTLFAIPGEMTMELLKWCEANNSWIELAYHGFFHSSNYECEKLTYEQFDELMHSSVTHRVAQYFVKGFRAPGWQISNACYEWLYDNDFWVADQGYNTERRPEGLKAWVNEDNNFRVWTPGIGYGGYIAAYHGHTWDVGWNGIYEDYNKVSDIVKNSTEFQFVSEVVNV